jgi:hypothetical protein
MKKIIFFAFVAMFAVSSCKKDRVCSCKTVTYTTSAGSTHIDVDPEEKYTMKDVSYRTAFNACTHTKEFYTYGSVAVEVDTNCELE